MRLLNPDTSSGTTEGCDRLRNGDDARHWVVHRERYDQILHRFTPHLMEATGRL